LIKGGYTEDETILALEGDFPVDLLRKTFQNLMNSSRKSDSPKQTQRNSDYSDSPKPSGHKRFIDDDEIHYSKQLTGKKESFKGPHISDESDYKTNGIYQSDEEIMIKLVETQMEVDFDIIKQKITPKAATDQLKFRLSDIDPQKISKLLHTKEFYLLYFFKLSYDPNLILDLMKNYFSNMKKDDLDDLKEKNESSIPF